MIFQMIISAEGLPLDATVRSKSVPASEPAAPVWAARCDRDAAVACCDTTKVKRRGVLYHEHGTSKVLRLPCKMTSEVSKVPRLPQKMQHIFWKYSKTNALATQNEFWHVLKHVVLECHEVTRLPRKTTWPHLRTRQKSHVFATFPIGTATLRPRRPQTDGCKHARTVPNGCGRLRTAEAGSREHRSTPRPPNVKREPFATHSGKKR